MTLISFPLQYIRQQAAPVDADQVFVTTSDRMAYLTNPRRYAGQIASDSQDQKVYVLNTARTTWSAIGGISGQTSNGIYYVSKKYVGAGAAVITGLTYASITSTNASYTTQLAAAVVGDEINTYPDPWAARNAALDAIAANTITKALIVVAGNSEWIIGSDVNTNNGDLVGVTTGHLVADVGFSIAHNTVEASLMQNGLTYFFNPVTLTYVNATYGIYNVYHQDLTDQVWESYIYGYMKVWQVYGEVNGFGALFFNMDNAASQFFYEASDLRLQQYGGINITNLKTGTFEIDTMWCPDLNLLNLESTRNGDGSDSMFSFAAKSVRKDNYAPPYPTSSDNWYTFVVGECSSTRKKQFDIDIENLYIRGNSDSSLFYCNNTPNARTDVNFTLHCDNFHFQQMPGGTTANALIGGAIQIANGTLNYTLEFQNLLTEAPLFAGFGLGATGTGVVNVTFDADHAVRAASGAAQGLIYTFGVAYNPRMKCFLKGYFENQNTGYPCITLVANSSFDINCKFILEGIFKQIDGQPVLYLANAAGPMRATNYPLAIINSILYNDATANAIEVQSNFAYHFYVKSSHITHGINSALTIEGDTLVINNNINTYL